MKSPTKTFIGGLVMGFLLGGAVMFAVYGIIILPAIK
jgi:hypothetical protein